MTTMKAADKALLPNNGIPINAYEPQPEPAWLSVTGYLPEIGDRKTFVPTSFEGEHQLSLRAIRPAAVAKVTGTVVYVHEAHRWYRVRFELPGGVPAFECFKY